MVEFTSCRLQAFVWVLYTRFEFVFTVHWPMYLFPSLFSACPTGTENVYRLLKHYVAFNETVVWESLTEKKCWCDFVIIHEVHFGWNVNFKVTQKQALTSRIGEGDPKFPKCFNDVRVIYCIVIIIRHWRITCNGSLFNKGFCILCAFVFVRITL